MKARLDPADAPDRPGALEPSARAMLDALPTIAFITDAEGATLYANLRYQDYTGLPAEALAGGGWAPLVHPEDRERTGSLWLKALRSGEPVEVEYRLRGADGTHRWFQGRAAPQRNDAGEVLFWLGTLTDIDQIKTAEARAQDREERFKTLADKVPSLVWFASPDGEVRYLNQRWYDYTGQTPEEAMPYGWANVVHPDDAAHTAAQWADALARGSNYEMEMRYRRRDGAYRWFMARAEPIRDTEGAITAWFGTSTDIDARKLAEDALRELNDELEHRVAEALAERKLLVDVFEGTNAMMSVVDADLRLRALNGAYADEVERLGGRRPRIGDRVTDIYSDSPELAASAKAHWGRAVAGEVFTMVHEIGEPERHRRAYERRFEPLYDRKGRLLGAYQYTIDVTERLQDQSRAEQAEAARREADSLYRAYFENSAEGLFVIGVLEDGGFTLEEANPAHRRTLAGFGFGPQPGRRLEEQLPPGVAEAVSVNYRRVIETGEIMRYQESAEIGGQMMHFETVLVPVSDGSGRITRIVGSGRDMTAQIQAEEALRQSQKMEAMGQLTGGVAHDFNNLLTPIVAVLDRLQRQGLGGEREQRLIAGAAQSAERAKTLVQRLLAFARRQPLLTTPVDTGELVRSMAELVSSTIDPQIRVVVDAPDDLPPAQADPHQLEMALLNLAVNARDAMPDGGTLRITVTAESVGERNMAALPSGPYIRISVADTGIGMDEATLARAVEPFFSTKGVGKGTGLGLSMVHGLASQLRGALTIQSRPRLGTNVELWLPQGGAAPDRAVPEDPHKLPQNVAGTVLLVDDDDAVRLSTADMLNELGYSVVEATSAEEGGELLDRGLGIDLLVTDHLMPGMTGTDLARQVQACRPGLPVLVISGYAESEGIEPDLPRLTKPFRKDELGASLAALGPTTSLD